MKLLCTFLYFSLKRNSHTQALSTLMLYIYTQPYLKKNGGHAALASTWISLSSCKNLSLTYWCFQAASYLHLHICTHHIFIVDHRSVIVSLFNDEKILEAWWQWWSFFKVLNFSINIRNILELMRGSDEILHIDIG